MKTHVLCLRPVWAKPGADSSSSSRSHSSIVQRSQRSLRSLRSEMVQRPNSPLSSERSESCGSCQTWVSCVLLRLTEFTSLSLCAQLRGNIFTWAGEGRGLAFTGPESNSAVKKRKKLFRFMRRAIHFRSEQTTNIFTVPQNSPKSKQKHTFPEQTWVLTLF